VRITRLDANTVCLSELNGLVTELLRRVVPSADPGDNSAARARLYSAPTHDAEETEFLEDWEAYIEPELSKLFLSSRELIEADLQKLRIDPATGEGAICIPSSHIDGWIHGLNQARIALAARFDFTEDEMEGVIVPSTDGRAFALVQVYIYAGLQQLFLSQLEHD